MTRLPQLRAKSPTKQNRNTALIGIAGVHHVVSELSRRGMIALATSRNTAAYDVLVTSPDGHKHAAIQVKTSLRKTNFFPMPKVDKINVGVSVWYVLLRWNQETEAFEGFMLSSKDAKHEACRSDTFQEKRIKAGTRTVKVSSIYVGKKVQAKSDSWRSLWSSWNL